VVWSQEPPPASPATTDRGTLLAEQRTEYAAQRTYLAAERTLMAWIRTSLSMISFGFTLVKAFEYLAGERKLPSGWFGVRSPTALGLTLISIGTLALVFAVIQHWQTLKGLRARGLEARWSLALTVATLVAALGVTAFGSLVLHF
jgi:inner membrane protein YidH